MKAKRLVGLGLATVLAVPVLASAAPPAARPAAAGFTRPVVAIAAPPGAKNSGYGTGGEPRLLVERDGAVVVSAHMQQWDCVTGKPTPGKGHQCVWLSTDHGRHFRFAGGEPGNQQGDDVDLAQSGSALVESTMTNEGLGTGVGGTTVSRTVNGGRTWTETVAANATAVNDRPFLLPVSDGRLGLTYLAIPGGIQAVWSSDGGASFGTPVLVAAPPNGSAVDLNGGPAEDARRHQLLVPYGWSTDPTCTSGAAGCLDRISVARADASAGAGSWTQETVATLAAGSGINAAFNVAADAGGAEYLAYGGVEDAGSRAHVYLTRNTAQAWSAPTRVDPAGGSAMLPATATGRAGRVVLAYYWSKYPDAQTVSRPWYLVVADSENGGATFRVRRVSDVAYVGSGANHQTVLWDLVGLAVEPGGQVDVAWTQQVRGGLTEIMAARSAG